MANGKKQGTCNRRDKRISQDESVRLGTTGIHSTVVRNEESGGSSESNSSRENSCWTNSINGNTPAGKILQRLELIERSHKDYVRAQKERLKAHLNESEELEQSFDQSIEELRQEIYCQAVAQQENEIGDGNQ